MSENNESSVAWSSTVTANHVTINHSSIRYLTAGEGEPMVLIHSVRTRSDFFQKMIPELSQYYRTYAIDLPGHGGSDIPEGKYDEPFFRDYVTQFIDALGLKKVTIVGESIGGTLSLTLAAADTTHNIKQVFSMNPADFEGGLKRGSLTAKWVATAAGIPVIDRIASNAENDWVLRAIMGGALYNKDCIPADLFELVSQVRTHQGFGRFFRAFIRNYPSWMAARQMYSAIKVPTTLIYGDIDWSTPDEREANKNAIPNSALHVLKNTGHFTSVDNPVGALEIILRDRMRAFS